MICLLDSSILVAAVVDIEPEHSQCAPLLERSGAHAFSHALTEVFSTLTGGRLGNRIRPGLAVEVIRSGLRPYLTLVTLSESDLMDAFAESEQRGIRGGAIHDFLHLFAARKVKAQRLYTLDTADFDAFRRNGDPEIAHPSPRQVG